MHVFGAGLGVKAAKIRAAFIYTHGKEFFEHGQHRTTGQEDRRRAIGRHEAEIKNESSFVDDLGADSLDTVELVMALEDEFETEIPDEEAEKITTVQQAIDYVSSNKKA